MKLQNILNFEVQKLLKQQQQQNLTTTNLDGTTANKQHQVLVKENLNVDSQEQLLHQNNEAHLPPTADIEVNILGAASSSLSSNMM